MIRRFRSSRTRTLTRRRGARSQKAGLHFGSDIHKATRRGRESSRNDSDRRATSQGFVEYYNRKQLHVEIEHRFAALRFAAVLFLLAYAFASLPGGAPAQAQWKKVTLKNGMDVIIIESSAVPLITVE